MCLWNLGKIMNLAFSIHLNTSKNNKATWQLQSAFPEVSQNWNSGQGSGFTPNNVVGLGCCLQMRVAWDSVVFRVYFWKNMLEKVSGEIFERLVAWWKNCFNKNSELTFSWSSMRRYFRQLLRLVSFCVDFSV